MRSYLPLMSIQYTYQTQDENTAMLIGEVDKDGAKYKIPLTLWKEGGSRTFLDSLHIPAPYPLYRLSILTKDPFKGVIICSDEEEVEFISKKQLSFYVNIFYNLKSVNLYKWKFTTWSGGILETIKNTDWEILNRYNIIVILVHPSKEGFRKSFAVYKAIKSVYSGNVTFFIRHKELDSPEVSREEGIKFAFLELAKGKWVSLDSFLDAGERYFNLHFNDTRDKIEVISGEQLLADTSDDEDFILSPSIANM